MIQPGDIVIRRFEGYIDKWFIPGFWNHAGLYIGDDSDKPEQVIHAVSEGVIQEDLLNFMRTDYMLILRAPAGKEEAISKAKSIVGQPYDFGFDFVDTNRFSCTELVAYCYPGIVEGKKRFGKKTIVADDFYNCGKLQRVWDSRESKIKTMGVVQAFFVSKCPIKKIEEKTTQQ
ncbi:MAG: YiiX/YebB-like N1pC/P60 family cysteine hydrolase [Promethearchaeota archaeon]